MIKDRFDWNKNKVCRANPEEYSKYYFQYNYRMSPIIGSNFS